MKFWKVVLIALLALIPFQAVVHASSCATEDVDSDCGSCGSKTECGTESSEPAAAVAPVEPAKAAVVAEPAKEKVVKHEHAAFPTLNAEELSKLIADKTPVVILDARSEKWDDGKRIPGAQVLTDKSTAEEVAKLIPAKDSKVVTYCSNLKCPASLHLAEHLKTLGYTNVSKYPGGIDDWVSTGKEVVSEKK